MVDPNGEQGIPSFVGGVRDGFYSYYALAAHQSGLDSGSSRSIAVDRAADLVGTALSNPRNLGANFQALSSSLSNDKARVAGRTVAASVVGVGIGRGSQTASRQLGKHFSFAKNHPGKVGAFVGGTNALANFTISQKGGLLQSL